MVKNVKLFIQITSTLADFNLAKTQTSYNQGFYLIGGYYGKETSHLYGRHSSPSS